MKGELGKQITANFVGLKLKMYSYLKDYISGDKNAKSIKCT